MNKKTKTGIIAGTLIAFSLSTCQSMYDETKNISNNELIALAKTNVIKVKNKNKPQHNHVHESIEGIVVEADDISFAVDLHKKYFQNLHLKLNDGTIHKIINKVNWRYKPGDFVSCKYIPCTTASYRDIVSGFDENYKHKVESGAVNTDGVWCELVMTIQELTKRK
ncbi:MAG: hypothetical protein AABW88_00865 [Nanoarchaeota archaeon]